MNTQIWGWFDAGDYSPPILGDGEFYIDDHTWRGNHARLLLMGELIDWARARGKENQARLGAMEAFSEAIARNDAKAETW